jgi:hypothetical protein
MSNTITPTVFYRTLNMEGLEIFYRVELFKRDIPSAELHLLDTAHFALEEGVDRIGSLMHEFLDRTINKK